MSIKKISLLVCCVLFQIAGMAQQGLPLQYQRPGNEKITAFYSEFIFPAAKKPVFLAPLFFGEGAMMAFADKNGKNEIKFTIYNPPNTPPADRPENEYTIHLLAKGENVEASDPWGKGKYAGDATWAYNWKAGDTGRFYVTTFIDSAGRSTDYTAYFFEPGLQEWKLIATYRYPEMRQGFGSIIAAAGDSTARKFLNPWAVTDKREWKKLAPVSNPTDTFNHIKPKIDLYRNVDSLAQAQKDAQAIAEYCKRMKMDCSYKDGIYYYIIKPGTKPYAKPENELVVYYRGTLLDGTVFDKTDDEPATFPLKRLIKGWQTGLQLIGEGGRMQLILPSAQAYGMRHLGTITPNSVLIFDIEIEKIK